MAEIKLYGNAVNGDGKYIISPFDIAAPKADGKTAYTEDDKAADKNIVSYINSKVATLTSGIGAVKTGIAEVTFSPKTVNLTPGSTVKTAVSVKGNDGSGKVAELSLTMPSADTIVTGANSYTHLVDEFKTLQNSYSTLNTTVTDINGASSGYRKGDTDTLKAAKDYADQQITDTLGTVYKVCGTKSLTEAKALTNVKKGNVYNISEAFTIDGKQYPEYTNLLFIVDAATVTWDSNKGFVGTQVDALGGVQDLSAYSLKANTVQNIAISDRDEALSDIGTQTIIASIGAVKEDGTTQAPVSITAKLPTTLVKASSPKITAASNKLSISGLTNLSGTTSVTPLTYQNVSTSITFNTVTTSSIPTMSIITWGELGTNYTDTYSIPTISANNYGFAAAGKGINVNNGVISIPENNFSTSKYLSISYKTNVDNGKNFLLDIVCSGKGSDDVIPLQKCDSTTLGIKIEAGQGTEDILLLQKNNHLALKADKLIGKVDTNTTNITSLEKRVAALETLLSLA